MSNENRMERVSSGVTALDNLDAETSGHVVESLVIRGDLSGLQPVDRARYYVSMCRGLGLNPASQPFEYLRLNGKDILYLKRGGSDQLAFIHRVNREVIDGPKIIDLAGTKLVYCVVRATLPNGRTETATATVPFVDPATVLMKVESKGKRRATLSILGLGLLDETEVESIPAHEKSETAQVSRADLADAMRELPATTNAPTLDTGARKVPDLAELDNVTGKPTARPASQPPPPSALQRFRAALWKVTTLAGIPALWRDLSQSLHNEGTADEAGRAVGEWMLTHHIPLNVAEENQFLAGNFSDDALEAFAGLSELATAADVVRWCVTHDTALKALPELDATVVKMVAARRWALLAKVTTKTPGKAFGEALKRAKEPPPDDKPPTGTDGPRSARNATATGDATSAPVESATAPAGAPVDLATVDAPGIRSDGGHDLSTRAARQEYLRTQKHTVTEVLRSYGAHSGLPYYHEDCAARLVEIPSPLDGTTPHPTTAERMLRNARHEALTKTAQTPARRVTGERVRKAG